MLKLKHRNVAPPSGFMFKDLKSGWSTHSWSFNMTAAAWYQECLRNHVDVTPEQCQRDVDLYVCSELMKSPGWEQWVMVDSPISLKDIGQAKVEGSFRATDPCFIQLGRFGDIILLLPAFQEIYRRTGVKPVVMVSNEYYSVFEGVSYVTPLGVPFHWYNGMPQARQLANDLFLEHTVLQCHGLEWGAQMADAPNYMTSMWGRAGFQNGEMKSLPLEFDLRHAMREHTLIKRLIPDGTLRPVILTKFEGVSSPFSSKVIVNTILQSLAGKATVINLDSVKAHRIYDLLGLYDNADFLITIDTSTLHLAAGSDIPYLAFTVDGWNSSVPKGNCILEVKYADVHRRLDDIATCIKNINDYSRFHPVSA